MTRNEACSRIHEALTAYFGDMPQTATPYGNGHINDTFLVIHDRRYILQRINHLVFPHPDKVMENILGVTEHIRKRTKQEGQDPARCTLTVLPTLRGAYFFRDSIGCYWRLYDFVEGTVTRESVTCKKDFYTCAKAFGDFQRRLADYPAERLHEAISHFHDTPRRYKDLCHAIEEDRMGRAESVRMEIEFAHAHAEFTQALEAAHKTGILPLRVTHNDTKLNNILFDDTTGLPVCVIDLDTVMPGYSVNDFGDSIRFGANTAAEDETDLSRVSLDLELFRAFAEGFLAGCGDSLTAGERELLPTGAIMMTLECGMRFLTDYLKGDIYFKIHRPAHNLDRCRNQFALVADMEEKLPLMQSIIRELRQ
ncbi:MAG: aminoglycoside phosphotransferase family protein [Clostridia bacterium]|nr:aminoglycoside phosphotransferase family protein [Clostridia bacterium]